jgi:hypothetical protein
MSKTDLENCTEGLLKRTADALEPFVNWPQQPGLKDYDCAAFVLDDIKAVLSRHAASRSHNQIERATERYLCSHDLGAP